MLIHGTEGNQWVYLRSLVRKLNKEGIALDKNFLELLPADNQSPRVRWYENSWELLTQTHTSREKENFNVWAIDYRTIVHPLSRFYDTLTLMFRQTPAQAIEAMKLLFRVHFMPPAELLTLGDKWLTIVVDDGAEMKEGFSKPVYWRHWEARKDGFEYKANRGAKPMQWYDIYDIGEQVIRQMGLPLLKLPYYEADDILGTLVINKPDHIDNFIIFTVDSDLLQLVNKEKGIGWYNVLKRAPRLRYEEEALSYWEVREKVRLDSVLDIITHKAERGDYADSIPAGSNPDLISLFEPRVPIEESAKNSLLGAFNMAPVSIEEAHIESIALDLARRGVLYAA